MTIDFSFYERCIDTLEKAYTQLQHQEEDSLEYDVYRSACIKEFEIILEQSGKLIRKVLKQYEAVPSRIDSLTFKAVLRKAQQRQLIDNEAIDRWMEYRDSRNRTAHDYGVNFAEETMSLISTFIADARQLADAMKSVAG